MALLVLVPTKRVTISVQPSDALKLLIPFAAATSIAQLCMCDPVTRFPSAHSSSIIPMIVSSSSGARIVFLPPPSNHFHVMDPSSICSFLAIQPWMLCLYTICPSTLNFFSAAEADLGLSGSSNMYDRTCRWFRDCASFALTSILWNEIESVEKNANPNFFYYKVVLF